LLESVKELPPLQVLEIKGEGLCHDRTVSRRPRLMRCKTCGSLLAMAIAYLTLMLTDTPPS
jgi:hypothetical protein